MPKSSRPRKQHRFKGIHTGPCFSKEHINAVCDLVNKVGLIVELTLPRGLADDKDIFYIQDIFNWGSVLMSHREKFLDAQALREARNLHYEALKAFSAMCARKREGVTGGYVATGDELRLIRECADTVTDALKESIRTTPRTTIKEFFAMRELIDAERAKREASGNPWGVFDFDRKAIERVCSQLGH